MRTAARRIHFTVGQSDGAEVIKQLFAIVSGESLQISLRSLRQCSVQLCRDWDNTELANEVCDADKDVFLEDFR